MQALKTAFLGGFFSSAISRRKALQLYYKSEPPESGRESSRRRHARPVVGLLSASLGESGCRAPKKSLPRRVKVWGGC